VSRLRFIREPFQIVPGFSRGHFYLFVFAARGGGRGGLFVSRGHLFSLFSLGHTRQGVHVSYLSCVRSCHVLSMTRQASKQGRHVCMLSRWTRQARQTCVHVCKQGRHVCKQGRGEGVGGLQARQGGGGSLLLQALVLRLALTLATTYLEGRGVWGSSCGLVQTARRLGPGRCKQLRH
jgi:hypothetical protein